MAEEERITPLGIAPFEFRTYRARLGGLARARKQLLKKGLTEEVKSRLPALEREQKLTRHILDVVSPRPTRPEYNLNISATKGGTTTPPLGVHSYPAGSVVQVQARVDEGYGFDHWELDGSEIADSSPMFQATMYSDHELLAVFIPLPLQQIWEFTAYYTYIGGKASDRREFEVKLDLPFPANYTASDVEKPYHRIAEMLAEEAMGLAFKSQSRFDKETWDVLKNLPWQDTPSSGGWDPLEVSETELKGGDEPDADAHVIDKTGHYWKGSIDVTVKWEYPNEKK